MARSSLDNLRAAVVRRAYEGPGLNPIDSVTRLRLAAMGIGTTTNPTLRPTTGIPFQQLGPGPTPMTMPNSLTPGTFPGPGPYTSGLDTGALTNTACSFISDQRLRALCIAASGLLPGSGSSSGGGGGLVAPTPCPKGYTRQSDGSCRVQGLGGFLPGDIGPQDFGWGTVNGRYGAGYVPIVVQRNYSACPPGSKLGKDGICYDRIARTNRKHDPGAKPFMTGGEVNVLRRAARLQKRGQKLLRKLSPARKVCAPKKGKKR